VTHAEHRNQLHLTQGLDAGPAGLAVLRQVDHHRGLPRQLDRCDVARLASARHRPPVRARPRARGSGRPPEDRHRVPRARLGLEHLAGDCAGALDHGRAAAAVHRRDRRLRHDVLLLGDGEEERQRHGVGGGGRRLPSRAHRLPVGAAIGERVARELGHEPARGLRLDDGHRRQHDLGGQDAAEGSTSRR
jgi:hypothetical protein